MGKAVPLRKLVAWGTVAYILVLSLIALLPNNSVVGGLGGVVHTVRAIPAPRPPLPVSAGPPIEFVRKTLDLLQYVPLWGLLFLQIRGRWRGVLAALLTVAVGLGNEAEHLLAPGRVFEGSDVLLMAGVMAVLSLLSTAWDQSAQAASGLLKDRTGR